ncbi:MAG: hypothetical protein HC904_16015 [Blastochloris sp.]|nr:hypothetical protein [Blastochloris sp.]
MNIRGFRRGIYVSTYYQMVLADIHVESSGPALINRGRLVLEDLNATITNPGPAILSNKWLTLVGAKLTGSGAAAIENSGPLYARNVETTGFEKALAVKEGQTPAPDGQEIVEYIAGPASGAFKARPQSLGLEIKKTPVVPWENDPSKWISPQEHKTAETTWSQAMQAAIDTPGKTHLALPFTKDEPERMNLDAPIRIRGDIARVHGTVHRFHPQTDPKSLIIIEDGSAPVVVLENMLNTPGIIIRTNRTVILDSVHLLRPKPGFAGDIILEGSGNVFLNSISANIIVRNAASRIFARQFNHEPVSLAVDIPFGKMWILGWKSENLGPRAEVGPEGSLEILGFNSSEVGKNKDLNPAFVVNDGKFSVVNTEQHGTTIHNELVRETRKGVTRNFTIKDSPQGRDCYLYSGY